MLTKPQLLIVLASLTSVPQTKLVKLCEEFGLSYNPKDSVDELRNKLRNYIYSMNKTLFLVQHGDIQSIRVVKAPYTAVKSSKDFNPSAAMNKKLIWKHK